MIEMRAVRERVNRAVAAKRLPRRSPGRIIPLLDPGMTHRLPALMPSASKSLGFTAAGERGYDGAKMFPAEKVAPSRIRGFFDALAGVISGENGG